jgi:hypothetical protein
MFSAFETAVSLPEICEHLQEIGEVSAEVTILSRYRQLQTFYGELETENFDTERELLQLPKLAWLKDTNAGWLKEQSWFKHALLPPTASANPHPAEPKREWLKKDEQEWLRI